MTAGFYDWNQNIAYPLEVDDEFNGTAVSSVIVGGSFSINDGLLTGDLAVVSIVRLIAGTVTITVADENNVAFVFQVPVTTPRFAVIAADPEVSAVAKPSSGRGALVIGNLGEFATMPLAVPYTPATPLTINPGIIKVMASRKVTSITLRTLTSRYETDPADNCTDMTEPAGTTIDVAAVKSTTPLDSSVMSCFSYDAKQSGSPQTVTIDYWQVGSQSVERPVYDQPVSGPPATLVIDITSPQTIAYEIKAGQSVTVNAAGWATSITPGNTVQIIEFFFNGIKVGQATSAQSWALTFVPTGLTSGNQYQLMARTLEGNQFVTAAPWIIGRSATNSIKVISNPIITGYETVTVVTYTHSTRTVQIPTLDANAQTVLSTYLLPPDGGSDTDVSVDVVTLSQDAEEDATTRAAMNGGKDVAIGAANTVDESTPITAGVGLQLLVDTPNRQVKFSANPAASGAPDYVGDCPNALRFFCGAAPDNGNVALTGKSGVTVIPEPGAHRITVILTNPDAATKKC